MGYINIVGSTLNAKIIYAIKYIFKYNADKSILIVCSLVFLIAKHSFNNYILKNTNPTEALNIN